MDILIKLRVYLWLMVLSLWGLMIYQFLEEDGGSIPQPVHWMAARVSTSPPERTAPVVPLSQFFPKPPDDLKPEPAPPSSGLAQAQPRPSGPSLVEPSAVGPLPRPSPPVRPRTSPEQVPARPSAPPAEHAAPAPEGFSELRTRHFVVYSEGGEVLKGFPETIENLHANLMLDLAGFSPWARDERVTIWLFRSQDSYRKMTGRPAWSGGATSVKTRKIFLYESSESMGILAHELCHIYFDSFFLGGKSDPLWLSEGMATLVQTERGLAAPSWLRENMGLLRKGGGYALAELLSVENTTGADDASVRLWYSQAYSVVRFLIRAQYRSSFYRFCTHLRDGVPIHDALYRAYGMPFNRVKALEFAWRYDLQNRRL